MVQPSSPCPSPPMVILLTSPHLYRTYSLVPGSPSTTSQQVSKTLATRRFLLTVYSGLWTILHLLLCSIRRIWSKKSSQPQTMPTLTRKWTRSPFFSHQDQPSLPLFKSRTTRFILSSTSSATSTQPAASLQRHSILAFLAGGGFGHNLHDTSLQFRLLRQGGHHVPVIA